MNELLNVVGNLWNSGATQVRRSKYRISGADSEARCPQRRVTPLSRNCCQAAKFAKSSVRGPVVRGVLSGQQAVIATTGPPTRYQGASGPPRFSGSESRQSARARFPARGAGVREQRGLIAILVPIRRDIGTRVGWA